jgi:hypothetical protein
MLLRFSARGRDDNALARGSESNLVAPGFLNRCATIRADACKRTKTADKISADARSRKAALPNPDHGYDALVTNTCTAQSRAGFACKDCWKPAFWAVKSPGTPQPEICRLRLAPASGISALTELWPSG